MYFTTASWEPLKKKKIRRPWTRAQCGHWLRRPCCCCCMHTDAAAAGNLLRHACAAFSSQLALAYSGQLSVLLDAAVAVCLSVARNICRTDAQDRARISFYAYVRHSGTRARHIITHAANRQVGLFKSCFTVSFHYFISFYLFNLIFLFLFC